MHAVNQNTALLIIDVQKGFDEPYWGRRNNPHMEHRILELLSAWRSADRLVVHAKHMSENSQSPLRPGQPGNEFKNGFAPLPNEPVVEKRVNSCFIGTSLETSLRERGIDGVVIVGLTTNHCVSTTVRMASNLGFKTWLVSDATATFDRTSPDGILYRAEEMHAMTLCDLHGEFAVVVTTEMITG